MHFQAVLFDLDGTLFDSLQDLAEAMNDTLSQRGFPLHNIEDYKYFVGEGFRNLVRNSLPENKKTDDALVAEITEQARKNYYPRMDRYSLPYPQIPELLTELSGRGFRLCVLSNKPDENTKLLVERHFSKWNFEIVFGARPDAHPIKPHPAGALEICKLMQLQPDQYLFLGDTAVDMKTAQAGGMFPVGVLWGFRSKKELLDNGARWLLETPMDLLDYLDGKKSTIGG